MESKINELKSLLIEIRENWEDFESECFKIDEKSWFNIEQEYDDNDDPALVIEEYKEIDSEKKYLGGYLVPGRCIESDEMLDTVCDDVLVKKMHRLS